MKSVDLIPYEVHFFHSAKGDCQPAKYISVLRLREIDRIQKRLADRAVLFYTDAANTPTVWTMKGEQKHLKNISYKKANAITHVVHDGPFTGLFLLSKKGVDFVLLEHVPDRPWRLRSKPRDFSSELNELMASCYNQISGIKKGKDVTQGLFIVYNAQLKYFASNSTLILAVLVRDTQQGNLHLLVGCLVRKLWRRWSVEEDYAVNSGIYIDPNGSNVTLLRCTITTSVEVAKAAPTVPLSLSVFDLVEPPSRCREASQPNTIACAFYHEVTVSLTDPHLPIRRTFQSLGFVLPPLAGDSCLNCPVSVESAPIPLFSFLIQVGSESFILQLTCSPNKDELEAECHTLPAALQISNPLALATMQLNEGSQQSSGPRVTFILTKDMKLFAFDGISAVEVRVFLSSDVTNDIKWIGQQMTPKRKSSKHQKQLFRSNSEASEIRLLPVGQHELFCTDGVVAVFLRLSDVKLHSTSLNEKMMHIAADILEPNNDDESIVHGRSLECLSDILASEPVSRQELSEFLLRRIAPSLRRVVETQNHVLLTQRVFVLLLRLFSPVTDEDWQGFWTLTQMLQCTIDRSGCNNNIVCTDQFFVDLIEQHYRSNPIPKVKPQVLDQKTDEAGFSKVKHAVGDKEIYIKIGLSDEVSFFLDGIASRTPLLSFAEEVVRRCAVLEILPNGYVGGVFPKEGCGEVLHAMGLALLASYFDIPLYIGVDGKNKAIRWSLEQGEPSYMGVPVCTLNDSKGVESVLTLAAGLLCVQTIEFPYGLSIPIVVLTISGRRHCLISLLKWLSPKIVQSLGTDTFSLSNNTEWLENCAMVLTSSPNEVVRTFIQAPRREGGLQNVATATALCYALCGTELSGNLSLFNYVQESISQELCIASIVMLVFTVTERLVVALNSYATSITKYILDEHGNDAPEAEEVLVCQRQFFAAIEYTLAVWAQANSILPYKVHNIAASYEATISMSFSSSVNSTNDRSTVVLRTLVSCFRILVLVYYSQMLEQRLEKYVLLCEKAVELGNDINESHPAVRASLEALRTIYALKGGGLPIEKFQGQLLKLMEEVAGICVSGEHSKSASWCVFFVRVLSLSGISETTVTSLKKRYCTLLDRLQNQLKQPIYHEEIMDSIRICTEEAEDAVYALSFDVKPEKQVVYFIFSHSRDSRIPQWVRDQALPRRKYLIKTDWTQRMWVVEGKTTILKDAIELLVSRIEEETKKTALFLGEAMPDQLSTEQATTLFENIHHILLPTHPRAEVRHTMLTQEVQGNYHVEEQRSRNGEGEKDSKEAAIVEVPLQGEPLELRDILAVEPPGSIVKAAKAAKISAHMQSPPSAHSQSDPTFTTLNRFSPQGVAWRKGLSPTLNERHCAPTDSIEEEPALSDTATTYTTSTSKSFTVNNVSQGPRSETLTSHDSSSYGEEIPASSGVKYHKKRCHHHHHHHHCHHCCCRCKVSHGLFDSIRMKTGRSDHGWFGEDPSARIVNALPLSVPRLHCHELRDDLCSRKIGTQPQQFSTALRPPLEPPIRGPANDLRTPIYQRIGTIQSKDRKAVTQESNMGLSLLTFSHHQSQHSHSPRVRLYSANLADYEAHMDEPKQGVEWMGTIAPSPFLDNVAARARVQYLEVPPIPSSDVFQKPPPLLHLRERVAIDESAAITATENNVPTKSMSCSTPKFAFPSAHRVFAESRPSPNVPGASQQLQRPQLPQEHTNRAPEQPFASSPEPSLLVQVPREQRVSMPRDDVGPVSAQPVSSSPIMEYNTVMTQTNAEVEPLCVPDTKQAILTPIEMDDFKRYVDNLLSKKNTVPSIPVPSDDIPLAAPPRTTGDCSWGRQPQPPPVTMPPRPPHGLTAAEQSQLVQRTIRQDNELRGLHRELEEMQRRAWGGRGERTQDGNRDRAKAEVGDGARLMRPAQVQTQPLSTADASVEAAPAPFHSTSARPSSGAAVEASISNTITDLEHLNAKLQAMNCSTEAMEKSLQKTRETIRSYEKLKAMEGMNVEEIALLNSLRCKTAAAERRLIELQGLPMATQPQPSAWEFQLQSRPESCLGASGGYASLRKAEIPESEAKAQLQKVVEPAEKRFINLTTHKMEHPEEAEQTDGGMSMLQTASALDPRPLPSTSLGMEQTKELMPLPEFIAPWSPYHIETFVSPNTREYLTVKETVWKDADEDVHAIRAAALTDAKATVVNSQHGSPACQDAPPHRPPTEMVSKTVAAPSFVKLTDLRTVYQTAPMRPSERIQKQQRRAPLRLQRSGSAVERGRKVATHESTARQLPLRTSSKDVPDRFYMYRTRSSVANANAKAFPRKKAQTRATSVASHGNSVFPESVSAAVSSGMLPLEDGNQPKVMEASVFLERQRRRRSENIEKRIHQLEREFA